ncbi:bifunctional enoyl-CoA hydratase/phosphate acetyltransferase [Anaeromyxobacter terrae]|uniref:bifunctional enoyl-CoA hydratase/phosphate acetyltransferase n=1 Tax=Anaeromyxobacter terrae TaxID=2925406 RepID=UPI001F58D4DD|nr:bifunctional enoyl-CoA hydratase/phosphate acetyltransferase [Anaeromyxobacter sp. SG22]
MIPIPTLERLVAAARSRGPLRVAVAAAENETALAAAALARRQKIAEIVLVGSPAGIRARLAAAGEDPADYRIEPAETDADAARRAVAMVRGGEAAVLMKGRLPTADLLRAILDRADGLRDGRLLSDVLVADHPLSERPRLLGVTDGGVNVAPTLAQKKEIVENAVRLFHALGYERPRVACLCAVETVNEAMTATKDAQALAEANARGELAGCVVSGPLALDNALSPEAARAKGIDHPVAGHADLLLVPTIETGNALGKAFTYLARRHVGHVIVGARAPVLIPSRVERAEDKIFSIALGVLSAASLASGGAAAPGDGRP